MMKSAGPPSSDELLRAAASLLRVRGSVATPGPWMIGTRQFGPPPQSLFATLPDAPGGADSSIGIGAMNDRDDDAWVATVSPRLAEPLARLLDGEASGFRTVLLTKWPTARGRQRRVRRRDAAVAVALAILDPM